MRKRLKKLKSNISNTFKMNAALSSAGGRTTSKPTNQRAQEIIINENGDRTLQFEICEYLPFDDNSFVWNQYSLCYGWGMFSDMADTASTFILGDLVGPEVFGDPKVVVILFGTSWCGPCYSGLEEID